MALQEPPIDPLPQPEHSERGEGAEVAGDRLARDPNSCGEVCGRVTGVPDTAQRLVKVQPREDRSRCDLPGAVGLHQWPWGHVVAFVPTGGHEQPPRRAPGAAVDTADTGHDPGVDERLHVPRRGVRASPAGVQVGVAGYDDLTARTGVQSDGCGRDRCRKVSDPAWDTYADLRGMSARASS